MRAGPVLLLLAACGAGRAGPTATVVVIAGDQPSADATVISSAADGTLLDEELADAVGHAKIQVEPGALITVVFPANLTDPANLPSSVALVSEPAPAAGGKIAVTGPASPPPPITAGALEISPMQALAADRYEIRLGCATIEEPALPVAVDVATTCFGSDANLDVLVLAYAGSPEQLVGYTAGRVPFADGVATFSPDTWETMRPAVPVVLDGVQPQVQWTLFSDGLPMWSEALAGQGLTWTGLQVDAVAITATLGDATASQAALRRAAGVPASIELGAADFLAPIAPSLVLDDPQAPAALHWTASGAGADATDVHLAWQTAGRAVTWDAVLPVDATSVHFPAIDDPAVTGLIEPPDAPPTARLRYIDASDLDGFAALVKAGIDLTEPAAPTIATPPPDGEIRTTEAGSAP